MITSDFLKKILNKQPAQEDYLPKIGQHVDKQVVSFKDNRVGFVIRIEGTLFEGINDNTIVSQFLNINQMLAVLGKDLGSRLGLWCTLHRRKIDFGRDLHFKTQFTRQFHDKYMAKFRKKDYFENIYYISGVLKYDDLDDAVSEARELIEKIKSALDGYDPYVLGVYQNQHGVMFSEIYEFLGSLINGGGFEQIPLSNQDAYTTLASANLHFGNELLEIRAPRATRFALMYDLKDFGSTKMMVLNPVLDLACEFVFTQSFVYIGSIPMQKKIDDQLNKLGSVGDLAESQQREMIEAKGHLAAGQMMFGDYHGALVVYGDTPKEAVNHAQKCTSRFLNAGGFRFIPATLSAPSTFFSQVPGSKGMPRPFPKASTNLAASFGMYNYAHGKSRGNPIGDGTAVMPLETVAGTLYDFNFHLTDDKTDNLGEKAAGHTLILGKTGTGKTTLQTAILSFLERFDPFIFAVDLDRGMEIWIRALGGSYFALEAGKETGLNPFQLPDTPKNREFLYDLVGACARDKEKALTAEEEKAIKSAVDTVMELDFHHRRFSAMMQIIPETYQENSLRTRLSMWCGENRYGWCLDNPTNLFDPEDFWRIGFDCTDILKDNYRPTEPVLAYLFHLKYLMLQKVARLGGICVSIVEEFWHPARYPMTQELILKALKTGRKLGEFMVLVTQSPEDAVNVPIFPAIVQQTVTKILLPNPDASWEGYAKVGLTHKEFDELIKLGDKSRTFLIKQSKQSSFAKLALPFGEFEDEIAVLSGDAANVHLMNEAMKECGSENPDDWLPLFQQMRHERKRRQQEKADTPIHA